jgi:hypothetical protein
MKQPPGIDELKALFDRKIQEWAADFVYGSSSGPENVGLAKFVAELPTPEKESRGSERVLRGIRPLGGGEGYELQIGDISRRSQQE